MNSDYNYNPPLTNGETSLRKIIDRRQDYNRRIGRIGELFVFEKELEKLKGTAFVGCVTDCADDPEAFCDIKSKTTEGEDVNIEVKATASSDPFADFYMSQREADIAFGLMANDELYELHRVFSVGGKIDRIILTAEWLFREYDFIGHTFAVRRRRTS